MNDKNDRKIGLVNFVVNNSYGSIHRFCPTEDFITQLKENKKHLYPYYSVEHDSNYMQEYNTNSFEMQYYEDYFDKNYDINIIGYINQSQNFYLISKFLNNGLTFIVINMNYSMSQKSILNELNKYMKILKKNAPDSNVVVFLRYPESNNNCLLSQCDNQINSIIKEKYPELVEIIIKPFTYNSKYSIIYDTFDVLQQIIYKYYLNQPEKFVTFNPYEYDALNMLLYDNVLHKKSVFTKKTIRSVCNSSSMDSRNFMNKLIKSGLFTHFEKNPLNNFFFKNTIRKDSIIPAILNIFTGTMYTKKKLKNGTIKSSGRHFLTSQRFLDAIPKQFKNKIPMSNRLMLEILKSLNVGRQTINNNKLYLRRYDFDEFNKDQWINVLDESNPRFVYNI